MPDDLRNAAHTSGNDWYLTGHRFQGDEAKRFQLAGKEKDVRNGEKSAHIILLSDEHHVVDHSVRTGKPLGFGTFRTVADHQQPRVLLLSDGRKNRDDILDSLDRTKI